MKPISLALLWHLHQPQYRLRDERVCPLPWVRLHGIRSYYDMVRVLDEFPEIRTTINLVPCLLEQIRAYERGESDLFLEMAAIPAEELDDSQKAFLFDHFFSAGETRMIGGLPAFAELHRRRHTARRIRGPAQAFKEFSVGDFRDLQALFDLCWFGFKAREDFPEIRALRGQGRGFTREDLVRIHAVEREILSRLIPLYRGAAASGQLEISASPYAHPILPLICDTQVAREALPDVSLPPRFRAPEDAQAQVREGLDRIEADLGYRPRGIWPSEGSLSQEVAGILARAGVTWAAGDELLLAASDREGTADPLLPWSVPEAPGLDLVFRDHDLSDRVGFTYASIGAGEAVADFLAALRWRAESRTEDSSMVLVALDGENPWENYADAGGDFLRTLYGALAGNQSVHCKSVGEAIQACPRRGTLNRIRAGSWIGAHFGIWIGGPQKNRAWELLRQTRDDVAPLLHDPSISVERRAAAWASLRSAEGSDWFWWLDGQFHSAYRWEFDRMFRGHLRQAYEALGKKPPETLEQPIPEPAAGEAETEPVEAPVWLSPTIDGFESDFFEWEGAIHVGWAALARRSTMERSQPLVEALEFGFTPTGEFLLRIDPAGENGHDDFKEAGVEIIFRAGAADPARLSLTLDERGDLEQALCWKETQGKGARPASAGRSEARAAARKILEIAIPSVEVGLERGQRATFQVKLRRKGKEEVNLEEVEMRVPPFEWGGGAWSVP
ncbi:MAG TPA: glycoside hydrolase family 57 protein [Candidatus Polarisedimenticolia bacterium]|nr:glycoside hydrolase family 57 protein [Candidatus Polarisedimenticolia bacterium]